MIKYSKINYNNEQLHQISKIDLDVYCFITMFFDCDILPQKEGPLSNNNWRNLHSELISPFCYYSCSSGSGVESLSEDDQEKRIRPLATIAGPTQ